MFYMTPQTLMSDLTTESCDPRDIVLIVIGTHLVDGCNSNLLTDRPQMRPIRAPVTTPMHRPYVT